MGCNDAEVGLHARGFEGGGILGLRGLADGIVAGKFGGKAGVLDGGVEGWDKGDGFLRVAADLYLRVARAGRESASYRRTVSLAYEKSGSFRNPR